MDQRLFSAAQQGDVDQLNAILKEDPSSLENIAPLPSGETPLHIATLAGKAEFVKEIMRLQPSAAQETNKQGLTPLHIASARGSVTIVKELLEVSPELSLAKDQGTRTPLHFAAMKGRANVIRELLYKSPDSAKEVTDKDETALHLAVKNSQFEALKALLEGIGEEMAAELLNAKDKEGQTVLQVAVAQDQLQASELLNKNKDKDRPEPEYGITYLDEEKPVEEKNVVTHRIKGHGKEEEKAKEEEGEEEEKEHIVGYEPVDNVFTNISRGLDDRASVVASLLAGATYKTGLSPPENLWAETMKLDLKCIRKRLYVAKQTDPVDACPSKLYLVFISFNTAGFLSALLISFMYRRNKHARVLLSAALVLMVLSYLVLTASLTPNIFGISIIFGTTLVSLICVLTFVHFLKTIIKFIIRTVARGLRKLHLV